MGDIHWHGIISVEASDIWQEMKTENLWRKLSKYDLLQPQNHMNINLELKRRRGEEKKKKKEIEVVFLPFHISRSVT